MTPPPDARIVEDLIAAGQLALSRSKRGADEAVLASIKTAADWLFEKSKELRSRP